MLSSMGSTQEVTSGDIQSAAESGMVTTGGIVLGQPEWGTLIQQGREYGLDRIGP